MNEDELQKTEERLSRAIQAIFGVLKLHQLSPSEAARVLVIATGNLLREVSPSSDLDKFLAEAANLMRVQAHWDGPGAPH